MTEEGRQRAIDQIEMHAISRLEEVLSLLLNNVILLGHCPQCSAMAVLANLYGNMTTHEIDGKESKQDFISRHLLVLTELLEHNYDEATNNASADPAPTHAGPGTAQ